VCSQLIDNKLCGVCQLVRLGSFHLSQQLVHIVEASSSSHIHRLLHVLYVEYHPSLHKQLTPELSAYFVASNCGCSRLTLSEASACTSA
jgi:hypothetical protein